MRAQDVLVAGFGGSHRTLEMQMADVTADVAAKRLPGANIFSIGSIYAHTLFSEDGLVQGAAQGKPTLWASGGWEAKTGIKLPASSRQDDIWAALEVDPATLKDYAAAVRAATTAYLTGASDAEMERKVTVFGQEQTVANLLTTVALWHVTCHSGEIAALKGAQGMKGLPF